jgi:hypothetical protein
VFVQHLRMTCWCGCAYLSVVVVEGGGRGAWLKGMVRTELEDDDEDQGERVPTLVARDPIRYSVKNTQHATAHPPLLCGCKEGTLLFRRAGPRHCDACVSHTSSSSSPLGLSLLRSGEMGMSCHGILENYDGFSARYRAETKVLFHRYHPIERSKSMTEQEKIPHMIDWWVCAPWTRPGQVPMRAHLPVLW